MIAQISRKVPYIELTDESSHTTPCQSSPQGSPPLATHPGREGDPNAAYKPLIAATSPVNAKADAWLDLSLELLL